MATSRVGSLAMEHRERSRTGRGTVVGMIVGTWGLQCVE